MHFVHFENEINKFRKFYKKYVVVFSQELLETNAK